MSKISFKRITIVTWAHATHIFVHFEMITENKRERHEINNSHSIKSNQSN